MFLDAATAAFLAEMARLDGPRLHQTSVEQARALSVLLNSLPPPGPQPAHVRDEVVRTAGLSVPVRVLLPAGPARALMVYFHGGGWVIGDLRQYDTVGRTLVARTGCAVALVDYRLAPEHPYPAAVDDCDAALRWAADHAEPIAGARLPLVVVGDGAGGNLAAVVARRAHERGSPRIDYQVLVYPILDGDPGRPALEMPQQSLTLTRQDIDWFWRHYVPDPVRRTEPDASPLHAPSLEGLPPALVITAEHDVLRDEGERYVQRLEAAGVAAHHHRAPGQVHGFFQLPGVLPGAIDAVESIAAALARHLPRSACGKGPSGDGPSGDGPTVDGPTVDNPILDGPTVDGPALDGPTAVPAPRHRRC